MKLLTKAQREKLLANGQLSRAQGAVDHYPVVKLFTPDAQATWLLSELYPDDEDVAFGLCDLGMGFPELGDVRLSDIAKYRGLCNLPVERDLHFTATQPITAYAAQARKLRQIVA